MNNQFKFKPDKNKYLTNVDTLDSTHKKIIEDINKKRDEVEIKNNKLIKLKNQLVELDEKRNEFNNIPNFIEVRAKIIDNIQLLEEEIEQINNYEEEMEYFSKTYQILFNYYDILDGQIESEINEFDKNNQNNSNHENTDNIITNINNSNDDDNNNNNNNSNDITNSDNVNNSDNINNCNYEKSSVDFVDEWNMDGTQIFNSIKTSTLDILNELSKKKRKEKKSTRKRVKNVESLIRYNNYDIFDFINSSNKNNSLTNIDNVTKENCEYSVYDRAKLYDDYKTSLEGYNSKKKYLKICENCRIDKVLIYSEGIYACVNCGEVENCIIESEITNYKEPMVEKPTFPYKRKNHFCELNLLFILLIIVITKNNGYFLY